MLSRFREIALLPLVLASVFPHSTAQISAEQARDAANAEIHKPELLGGSGFLRLLRRQDLEDEFCEFAWLSGKVETPPCVFLFEATSDGPEFSTGKLKRHTCCDACPDYYVAVSIPDRDVFPMLGIQRSLDEFNRLASAYHVKISSETDAVSYARLYFELVHFNRPMDIPSSPLDAKRSAELKFYGLNGHLDAAEKELSHWWKKNGDAIGRQSFEWSAHGTAQGYEVKFPQLSDVDRKRQAAGPALLACTIEVAREGLMEEPQCRPAPLR